MIPQVIQSLDQTHTSIIFATVDGVGDLDVHLQQPDKGLYIKKDWFTRWPTFYDLNTHNFWALLETQMWSLLTKAKESSHAEMFDL